VTPITIEVIPIAGIEFSVDRLILRDTQKLPSETVPGKGAGSLEGSNASEIHPLGFHFLNHPAL
jgi:hypothetical protein